MRISDWSSDVCSSDLDFHGSVGGMIYGGRVPECRSRTWRLRSPSWEYCLGQDRPLIRIARIELGSGRLVGGQSRQQVGQGFRSRAAILPWIIIAGFAPSASKGSSPTYSYGDEFLLKQILPAPIHGELFSRVPSQI